MIKQILFAIIAGLMVLASTMAQVDNGELSDEALIDALQAGGYNIYFRHAATDWSQSDHIAKADDWTSCDPAQVRQLSEPGRQTAQAVGAAMRALNIPVSVILASPYCRTVETAQLLELGPVETSTDIMNMRVAQYFGGRDVIAENTRKRLSSKPPSGGNTVLVAHGNVLVTATQIYPQEAEAIVFQPQQQSGYKFIARISPQRWSDLAAQSD